MSNSEEPAPVSFAADIRPLFRDVDRASMRKAFDLWNYDDVKAHRDAIVAHLADGSMPCDGPWPAGNVALISRWATDGARP
jgi:hypothetical protein